MTDKYKMGGAGAGAIAGFLFGGPPGAVIGGIVGWLGGGALEAHQLTQLLKTVDTAITLSASAQAINVKAGGLVALLPPAGGSIGSVAPAQILPATFTSDVRPERAILRVMVGGAINVTWQTAPGHPQTTALAVVTT